MTQQIKEALQRISIRSDPDVHIVLLYILDTLSQISDSQRSLENAIRELKNHDNNN